MINIKQLCYLDITKEDIIMTITHEAGLNCIKSIKKEMEYYPLSYPKLLEKIFCSSSVNWQKVLSFGVQDDYMGQLSELLVCARYAYFNVKTNKEFNSGWGKRILEQFEVVFETMTSTNDEFINDLKASNKTIEKNLIKLYTTSLTSRSLYPENVIDFEKIRLIKRADYYDLVKTFIHHLEFFISIMYTFYKCVPCNPQTKVKIIKEYKTKKEMGYGDELSLSKKSKNH